MKIKNFPTGNYFLIDLNCALICRCVQPELPPGSGVSLYLPHCVEGLTLNYCQAVCSGKQVSRGQSAQGRVGRLFIAKHFLVGKLSLYFPPYSM